MRRDLKIVYKNFIAKVKVKYNYNIIYRLLKEQEIIK